MHYAMQSSPEKFLKKVKNRFMEPLVNSRGNSFCTSTLFGTVNIQYNALLVLLVCIEFNAKLM